MNTEDPQADIKARQAVLRAADRVAAERAVADPQVHSTDLLPHRKEAEARPHKADLQVQEVHLLPAETTMTDHTETAEAHLPGAERRKSESVPDSTISASWFYIPLSF